MLKRLDRYWFGYGSPVSLGVFRILMGTLACVNLIVLAFDFDAWFTDKGFVTHETAARWAGKLNPITRVPWGDGWWQGNFPLPRLNLLSEITSTPLTAAFFAITLLAAILTTVGLWTRISSIVLAAGLVTLHHRNMIVLHGGDTVLRVMTLYLAIAPSGAACSLDRLIALWRGKADAQPRLVSMWPQRLITYNVAIVYFTTVWHKWFGERWRDGTATWYPARLDEFKRFPVPGFVNEMPFVKFATYGTLFMELALATLVFYKPLRKWVLLGGLLMHGYIEYSMNIPLFSFLITSAYVCFYEGEDVSAWAKRLGERFRRFRIRIFHPRSERLRPGPALTLEALDPLGLVTYEPGEEETWSAEGGRSAFRASWARSLGAWPLGLIPGAWARLLGKSLEPVPSQPSRRERAKMHS